MIEANGRYGAVAAAHPLAVEAGLGMLQAGGNAVDAAVATGFALMVVDPGNASLAGRGAMLIYLADKSQVTCLDFNTICPSLAQPDTYRIVPTRPGEWWSVEGFANSIGHRAVSVPSTAAGLGEAARRYATRPLADLVEPAACIAEQGFSVTTHLEVTLAIARSRLLRNPASAAIYAPEGRMLRRGELLCNRDLACSLRAIGRDGYQSFYVGEIAQRLLQDMQAHDGLITAPDLANYRPVECTPARTSYRGYDICVTPVCNGGPAILQTLNILEGFDITSLQPFGVKRLHLIIESMKLAWADRLAVMADPAFSSVPLAGLLSKEYAAERRKLIDASAACHLVDPGDPWAYDTGRPGPLRPSPPTGSSGGNTTYCCAADSSGNLVSLTHTLGSSFGSGVTTPGTGILLNNGMNWFDPRPSFANSIETGKRPLNNQGETIVLQGGKPLLAIGSPGGRRLINTVTLALSLILDHGFSPASALAAPRLHVEAQEPVLVERDWQREISGGMELMLDLQELGHQLTTLGIAESFISGPAHAIRIEPDTGNLQAAGDPRHPSAAGAR